MDLRETSLYEAFASLTDCQGFFIPVVKTLRPALAFGLTGSLIGNSLSRSYPTYSATALGLGLSTSLFYDASLGAGLYATPIMAFGVGVGATSG